MVLFTSCFQSSQEFSVLLIFVRTKLSKQNSHFSVCTLNCVCRAWLWHIVLNFPIYAFPFLKSLSPLSSQELNKVQSLQ